MIYEFYGCWLPCCIESKDPGSNMPPVERLTSGWIGFGAAVLLVADRATDAPMPTGLVVVWGLNKACRS